MVSTKIRPRIFQPIPKRFSIPANWWFQRYDRIFHFLLILLHSLWWWLCCGCCCRSQRRCVSLFNRNEHVRNAVCLLVCLFVRSYVIYFSLSICWRTFTGSKRKSKGMATEHDVHEAGGQKCVHQNLNIAFVFWILRTSSATNQLITKKIIDFIKGTVGFGIFFLRFSVLFNLIELYGVIHCNWINVEKKVWYYFVISFHSFFLFFGSVRHINSQTVWCHWSHQRQTFIKPFAKYCVVFWLRAVHTIRMTLCRQLESSWPPS